MVQRILGILSIIIAMAYDRQFSPVRFEFVCNIRVGLSGRPVVGSSVSTEAHVIVLAEMGPYGARDPELLDRSGNNEQLT